MDDVIISEKRLPQTLPELSKFVLIGREKLNAVRAEIRAIKAVNLATEVYEQKLEEAQEIADAVLDAEVKIGELTAQMQKSVGGRPSKTIRTDAESIKTKSEQLAEIGIKQDTAERFERMASNPKAVKAAKEEARQNNEIVTRAAVLRKIEEEEKKPHVANNSQDDEWYTPEKYIELAREVMGTIDLDPASNDFANETVRANTFFTEEMNGLEQGWFGNVWLNPPYSSVLIQKFAEKVAENKFKQAIILVNNATETAWFEKMVEGASAIVFHKGRIKFNKRDGQHGSPLQGQAFIYYGSNPEQFLKVFSAIGWGAKL